MVDSPGGTSEPSRAAAEALFLAHQSVVESVIRFVCHERGLRPDDAEEFAGQVRLRLIEADYEVLRKFQGRSSIRTYLTVVIRRLALDYQAARWGKWRASAVARANGPAAIRLEQLVARDAMAIDAALDLVERQFEAVDRAALIRLATRFPLRTRRVYVGEELLEFAATDSPDAERILVQADEASRFNRVAGRLKAFLDDLTPQERLVLQLRFGQGMKVVDIARLLQLDQKRLYRTIEHALGQLRESLEAEGVHASDVREMLAAASSGADDREAGTRGRLYEGTRHEH
jgi:RNA polymerase sigma factor (sigma-70 family)